MLVFYTAEGMEQLMIQSSSAMETAIRAYFVEANLGNTNSEIPLEYNVVHVAEVNTRNPVYFRIHAGNKTKTCP